jgi:DNA-binding transcriptional LysR family regulator
MGGAVDSAGEMAAFVEAAKRASFSDAARALKLTPSALSKLVSRLETRLGVRLMQRTTRRVTLTPEGDAFFRRAERILGDIREAENEAASFRERPRGLLRVNVGNSFGIHQLAPALPAFLARYPDIKIELAFADAHIDLIASGADLAVRIGPVRDDRLIVRQIAEGHRMICASPAYLARRGMPKRPDDLRHHDCIALAGMASLNRWPFRDGAIAVSGPVASDSASGVHELGLCGLGLIRLSDFALAGDVRDGRLVPVLEDWHASESVPISAIYPVGRHRVPKTAAFVAFLQQRFGHRPWRLDGQKDAR